MAEWKSTIVPLEHPVKLGETVTVHLELREPDVEGLELIESLGLVEGSPLKTEQLRQIVASLARVDNAVVLKMHPADFKKAAEVAVPLLGATSVAMTTGASPGKDSTTSSPIAPTG